MAALLSPALAVLPSAAILTLMLWRRFSATRAGLCGLAVAIAVTALHFGATATTTALAERRERLRLDRRRRQAGGQDIKGAAADTAQNAHADLNKAKLQAVHGAMTPPTSSRR